MPYPSRTNGQAGRFIQRSLKEWAYSQAYEASAEREDHLQPCLDQRSLKQWAYSQAYESPVESEKQLLPWLGRYNHRRPHTH